MIKSAGKTTTSDYTSREKQAVKKAKRLFFISFVDISWRLAVSLIFPILLGNWLDDKLDKEPVFTIIGLVIGFGLAGAAIRNMVIKIQKETS